MNKTDQGFRLTSERGSGVCCDENGLFVGGEPLLEFGGAAGSGAQWQPRGLPDLNRDLGECYGVPIEFDQKVSGLGAVARALNRGDIGHAQIVALHLRLPDPPDLKKSARTSTDILELARSLKATGILKAEWDPAKHPRWPAKSPDGVGGEFAPSGGGAGNAPPVGQNASLIPAQLPWAIPGPLESPFPETVPLPSEIGAPPLVGPQISPRQIPRNPYPNRPECVDE